MPLEQLITIARQGTGTGTVSRDGKRKMWVNRLILDLLKIKQL